MFLVNCLLEEKPRGKKIFKRHLNRHEVIRLDVQQFLFHDSHLEIFIHKIQEAIIKELREEYGNCFEVDQYGLPNVLKQIFAYTGKGFVFIIDEWDCVFRIARENTVVQKEYLDFLRGLFKGQDYVELAYMTGILPIKKYGEHSAVNIFDEYSMIDPGELADFLDLRSKRFLNCAVEEMLIFPCFKNGTTDIY